MSAAEVRGAGAAGVGRIVRGTLPFRVGATSFIYRDDVLPNVRKLAALVDDVEIVIYEYNERSPLPDAGVLAELQTLAVVDDLTYTVHLPLDLTLAAPDAASRDWSVATASEVMAATACLRPWAWVVHAEPAPSAPDDWAGWRRAAGESLQRLGEAAAALVGDAGRLCVENLESAPPELPLALAEQLGIGACLDVGHLFKSGLDATPHLDAGLARTRVVHLHGWNGTSDHVSLAALPHETLTAVVERLWRPPYAGVVTLEVFSEEDLIDSWRCLKDDHGRVTHTQSGESRNG